MDATQELIRRLKLGEDIRSSDRERDKIRQRLRKDGLIEFTGKPRRWQFTEAGKAHYGLVAD